MSVQSSSSAGCCVPDENWGRAGVHKADIGSFSHSDREFCRCAGRIMGGTLMSRDRVGDKAITGAAGRIQPDRRWFGNTRVIGQAELDKFREEMTEKVR